MPPTTIAYGFKHLLAGLDEWEKGSVGKMSTNFMTSGLNGRSDNRRTYARADLYIY